LNTAELYDPATGNWSSTDALQAARYYHTATLLLPSGNVLVAGGYNSSSGYLNSAELYDPVTGRWSGIDPLHAARFKHTATQLHSGEVLVAGGYNGSYLSSAELYDPVRRRWSSTGSLADARELHTATLLLPSGKVLVAGGNTANYVPLRLIYLSTAGLYDPARDAGARRAALAPRATLTRRRYCNQAKCSWREEAVILVFT
jgi:Kelch motif.